jgi:5-methylcytosine-specific restriction enzyme subunit McrC
MKQFVISLDILIKKGLRFDYRRIEEQQSYLRGQLDIIKQLRQPPGRDHVFNIRHDLYLPDRAENRLLHSALLRVCQMTQQAETWRLSHELVSLLSEIPQSTDIKADFKSWQSDRMMSYYQGVRPWCELVLGQYMPMAIRGSTKGISLLFPMEQLFERHVELHLRNNLSQPYSLKAQAASEYLCDQAGSPIFQLRPDLLIQKNAFPYAVLDTKWKLISSEDRSNKYGLTQADFYQLFAYGNKYLGGKGPMALIYPRTSKFQQPIPEFDFGNGLTLQVLPFDIEAGRLIGFETLFTNSYDNIIAA